MAEVGGELGHFGGLPIVYNEHVEKGTAYIVSGPAGRYLVSGRATWASMADMPTDTPLTQKIIDRLRREAVVLMPIALAIYSVWPDNVPVTSYKVWAPIVVGALLRQFFTSPSHEVERRETNAYLEGLHLAPVLRKAKDAIRAEERGDPLPEPGPGDLEPGEPGPGFRPIQ